MDIVLFLLMLLAALTVVLAGEIHKRFYVVRELILCRFHGKSTAHLNVQLLLNRPDLLSHPLSAAALIQLHACTTVMQASARVTLLNPLRMLNSHMDVSVAYDFHGVKSNGDHLEVHVHGRLHVFYAMNGRCRKSMDSGQIRITGVRVVP